MVPKFSTLVWKRSIFRNIINIYINFPVIIHYTSNVKEEGDSLFLPPSGEGGAYPLDKIRVFERFERCITSSLFICYLLISGVIIVFFIKEEGDG